MSDTTLPSEVEAALRALNERGDCLEKDCALCAVELDGLREAYRLGLVAGREDSELLDWLEANGCWQFQGPHEPDDDDYKDRWFDSLTQGSDYSPTLRAAIRAAKEADRG